mmetsp:Transcript_6742/g.15765  ORF Transcript_6742/g.15765 Transcript_6742/m.15765 type:complete len:707 (-) Transcript_6742:165-2285(-)
MKFGKFLLASRVKGWETFYVEYKTLTKAIKAEIKNRERHTTEFYREEVLPLLEEERPPLAEGGFPAVFQLEVNRLNTKFNEKMQDIEERKKLIQQEAARIANTKFASADIENVKRLQTAQFKALQHSLRELYQECMTLKQVCDLNFTGLSKAKKKYTKRMKQCIGGASLSKIPDIANEPFHAGIDRVHEISEDVERIFADNYTNGDMKTAQRRLRHLQRVGLRSKMLMGFLLGACLEVFITIIWLLNTDTDPVRWPDCAKALDAAAPVYRVLFLPLLWLWCWAGISYVLSFYSINYPYIMAINPYTELGFDRSAKLASFVTLVTLSDFAGFLSATRTGYEPLGFPYRLYPIGLLIFAVFAIVAPKGSFNFKSRRYLFKALLRISIAPFGSEVRFVDNYIADVLTSLAVFLRDIDYTVQYYVSGAYNSTKSRDDMSDNFWVSAPLITALPYWWRMQQCIRRFYDAGPGHPTRPAHLLNAGKYLTSLVAICLASLGDYTSLDFSQISTWGTGKIAWFILLCVGTIYAYAWDIFMDWGLVERIPPSDGPRKWFPYRLRQNRIYPTPFYGWCAVSNLFGRLFWALTITPHGVFAGVPRGVSTTSVAVVELLRRAQWSLLRVENEYLSNPSNYRSVKDVPMILHTEMYMEEASDPKKRSITAYIVGGINTVLTIIIVVVIYFKTMGDYDLSSGEAARNATALEGLGAGLRW